MPAQVADWEQVKATAIATGNLKEAADAHGIEYGAVRVRAHREQWPVGLRVHKMAREARDLANQVISQSNGGNVTAVTPASEVLSRLLQENRGKSKLAQSKYLVRSSEKLAEVPEEELLAHAQTGVALATMAAKVYPEEHGDGGTVLQFFSIQADRQEPEQPVIDV